MQLFRFFKSISFTFGQQYYKNESIHLNSWHHSHKKQKDGLETQVRFVDIFFHELEIPNIWGAGWLRREMYIKTTKNGS